jgi:[acyl-carrier-protein] S-malonyltransferase
MPRQLAADFPALKNLLASLLGAMRWDTDTRRLGQAWPRLPRSKRSMQAAHVGTAAFSLTATQLLEEAGITPDVVMGHSLGLHSALAASGASHIPDTLEVVDRTARFIAAPANGATGGMMAVTGFTPAEIVAHCEQNGLADSVFVAIVNSPRQVVVSGRADSLKRFVRLMRQKQVWNITRLPGRRPLHSPLMAREAEACYDLVETEHCHVPHVTLLHPATGETVSTASSAKALWRTHLLNSIDFVRCMDVMKQLEISTYIEVGVGETLSRLVRWYDRGFSVVSIGTPGVLERTLDAGLE